MRGAGPLIGTRNGSARLHFASRHVEHKTLRSIERASSMGRSANQRPGSRRVAERRLTQARKAAGALAVAADLALDPRRRGFQQEVVRESAEKGKWWDPGEYLRSLSDLIPHEPTTRKGGCKHPAPKGSRSGPRVSFVYRYWALDRSQWAASWCACSLASASLVENQKAPATKPALKVSTPTTIKSKVTANPLSATSSLRKT